MTAAGRPWQEPGPCCVGSALGQTQQQSVFQGVQSTNTMEISFCSAITLKICEILTIISIGDISKLLKKMKSSFSASRSSLQPVVQLRLCLHHEPRAPEHLPVRKIAGLKLMLESEI